MAEVSPKRLTRQSARGVLGSWAYFKEGRKKAVMHRSHGNAKLTWIDVREIIKIGRTKPAGLIAFRYAISKRSVLDILNGKTWRYPQQWDHLMGAR